MKKWDITIFCFLAWGCAVDFSIPLSHKDSKDAEGDEYEYDIFNDVILDDWDENEIDQSVLCGNGVVEEGEECDQSEPAQCTTTCETEGIMECIDCRWSECIPPEEICDGIDENCNGIVDEGAWISSGEPVLLNSEGGPSFSPVVSWAGEVVGILWEDWRTGRKQLFFSALDTERNFLVDEIKVTDQSGGAGSPALKYDGESFYASWIGKDGADRDFEVYAALLGSDGIVVISPQNISGGKGGDERSCDIVKVENGFAVAWSAQDGVYVTLIDNSLSNANTRKIYNSSRSRKVCLTENGGVIGIFWEDGMEGTMDILGTIVGSDGSNISGTIQIATGAEDESKPDCVPQDGFWVVWQEREAGVYHIEGVHVDSGGITGEKSAMVLCDGNCTEPSIENTGDSLSIAGIEEKGIEHYLFVVRTDFSGNSVEEKLYIASPEIHPEKPDISSYESHVAVAFESDIMTNKNVYVSFAGCE